MYKINLTTKFKKDLKKIKWVSADFKLTTDFIKTLKSKGVEGVDIKMKPHKLKGNYKNNWECHIKPDLLIIWIQKESPSEITLVRLGSHSDLFK